MTKVFVLQMQGWGPSEDLMYNVGTFSTLDKAEAKVESLLQDWEEDGGLRDEVEWEIEEFELDA